jgi:hypothetical protein
MARPDAEKNLKIDITKPRHRGPVDKVEKRAADLGEGQIRCDLFKKIVLGITIQGLTS